MSHIHRHGPFDNICPVFDDIFNHAFPAEYLAAVNQVRGDKPISDNEGSRCEIEIPGVKKKDVRISIPKDKGTLRVDWSRTSRDGSAVVKTGSKSFDITGFTCQKAKLEDGILSVKLERDTVKVENEILVPID